MIVARQFTEQLMARKINCSEPLSCKTCWSCFSVSSCFTVHVHIAVLRSS